MKSVFLMATIFICTSCLADVIEVEDGTASSVIEVYEEMQEQEEDVAGENGWIHDFEKESVGNEMDHLTGLKRTADNHEEM